MRHGLPANHIMTRRDFATRSTMVIAGLLGGATGVMAARSSPVSVRSPDPKLIEDLVAANRILADQGIVDGFGHVSVRHDADPKRYLMSRDLAPALVTADDILEYDMESNAIDAKGRSLYRERFIHGEIYKARPDVKAVVHDHSAGVIPFSLSSVPLRPAFHMAAFVVDGVPVFDPSREPGVQHVLVVTPEAGRALARTLGPKAAVLLRGHGAAVVGTSLPMVVGRAIYLDQSARIQAQAMALGGEVTYLDPQAARAGVANTYAPRAWDMWKRKAMMK